MPVGTSTPRSAARRRPVPAMLGFAVALVVSACGGAKATLSVSPTASAQSRTTASATPTVAPGSSTATPTPPSADEMAYAALRKGQLVPIDVTKGTAEAPIQVDENLSAIAITPDGSTAYVADGDNGTLFPVDLRTGSVGAPIQVSSSGDLTAVAITPDGTTALTVVDTPAGRAGSVVPVTLATGAVGPPIAVGVDPDAIAITPDGTTAYVANFVSETVTPISIASGTTGPRSRCRAIPSPSPSLPTGAPHTRS